MTATWLDVDVPGGSDCVMAALTSPRNKLRRFEAHYMEDVLGHKFFYSRVIEADTEEAAKRLARQWSDQHDDDLRWIKEI